MSFAHVILGLVFAGATAFMLFAAWAALMLGHQTAWRWLTNTLAHQRGASAIRS